MNIKLKAVAIAIPIAIAIQAILITIGFLIFKENLNFPLLNALGLIGGFLSYFNVKKWLYSRLSDPK